MAKETKKNEGPTCACGKVDLYEEWNRLNENKNKEKGGCNRREQADEIDGPVENTEDPNQNEGKN